MKEPHEKYYEIPLEGGISEEQAQEEFEQGVKILKELIEPENES